MRCENCGEREAVIHLTQVVDATITTLHLCEQCAAEKGIEAGGPIAKFPLGDFLASLGKSAAGGAVEEGEGVVCPGCGGSLKDFRQTGRLGCARCYDVFEAPLRDLLRRLHGTAQHEGERYAPSSGGGAGASPQAPEELRERLRRAVEAEDFELAAKLRDAIRGLE